MSGIPVPAYDTVAALQAATVPSNETMISTNGYTTLGDGGGKSWIRTSASSVGTIQSADGQNWAPVWEHTISPMQFGAKGDGTTNDIAAINAAITTAATLNYKLDGGKRTYAVSGNVQFSYDYLAVENLTLKQLDPAPTNRKTFFPLNCNYLRLKNITVNRNGSGAGGSLLDAAGIWISGGVGHYCENLQAYGNDMGTGVAIVGTAFSVFVGCYGHNIAYDNPAANDDVVQGVWMAFNTRCSFVAPRAFNLTGNATGAYPTRYTRGIAAGGNSRCTFSDINVEEVDQGFDLSGSDGNVDCEVIGGNLKDCASWGVKLANSAVRCRVIGVTVDGCGLSCFVTSGPSLAGLTNKSMDNVFINCVAREPGRVSSGVPGPKVGFAVQSQPIVPVDQSYPKGIKIIGCLAIDEQSTKTMTHCYWTDVVYDKSGKINELIDCRGYGYTAAFSAGFATPYSKFSGSGSQSIPNNISTQILWDTVINDNIKMQASAAIFNAPMAGVYRITVDAYWAASATGYRRLDILKNGAQVPGGTSIAAAATGIETAHCISTELYLLPSDTVRAEATQTSGGALNFNRTLGGISISLVETR